METISGIYGIDPIYQLKNADKKTFSVVKPEYKTIFDVS